MKYLNIFIISIIMPFGIISCSKQLEQFPTTNKSADKFYVNEKEVEEAVTATYASLQATGTYDLGLPALGEIPGEDVYSETPGNDGGVYGQLNDFNLTAQNDLIGNVWKHSYVTIQRANIVLNRIQTISYSSETTKANRIGEMKFIRALMYFNLVRAFGKVPLVTEEVTEPLKKLGQERASVEEVYNQIKKDLTEAINLLPERTESNKIRVFKTASQALLGKVFLTLKDYSNASIQLKAVESSVIHQLIPTAQIATLFASTNELNKEIIFSVQFASGVIGNTEGTTQYQMFNPADRKVGSITGTKGHGVIKKTFYDLYATDDTRKNVYVGLLGNVVAYNNKVAVPTTTITNAANDWIVLRYADVLLMLAEIENELGNILDAQKYLNAIRNRAGISDYSGAMDKSSLFAEIDMQRRKELIWEGHRWFDLLRQGRAQSVLGITNENKLLMPIPASQIATDGALKQNNGY